MTQEQYIKELEERIDRQRHTIISLKYKLDRKVEQSSKFANNTLELFSALGYRKEDVISMYLYFVAQNEEKCVSV